MSFVSFGDDCSLRCFVVDCRLEEKWGIITLFPAGFFSGPSFFERKVVLISHEPSVVGL